MSIYAYIRGKNQPYEHPAHKRRFPRFASRKNLEFSDYLNEKSIKKVNILSPASDITFWRRAKIEKNCKIIFDANDPFLLSKDISFTDKLRGLYKYLSGNHKYLEFNYRKSYLEICKVADLVIVGHRNQYELLKNKSIKVCLIPDYAIETKIENKTKFNLSNKKTINIFWEGLGSSFMPFKLIEKIFKPINHKFNFVFHFATDLSFYKYGDQFISRHITEIAKKSSPKFYKQFRFYHWSEYMMNKIAISCDFAIIPLPIDNSLNYWKPENKLIHMWRMALPTIASNIPSYSRVMKDSNQNLCANNLEEWRSLILKFSTNESLRKNHGLLGKKFVDQFYSNEKIDSLWETNLSKL